MKGAPPRPGAQNTPCQRCVHATGYKTDQINSPSLCPFCYSLVNTTSPCRVTNFTTAPTNVAAAIASDTYVATYCRAVAANGTRDPGCDSYVNETRQYSVPSVNQACDYVIKNVTVNAPQLYSARFAIFTCRFVDPLGTRTDTTPKFAYQNPMDIMSKTTKDQLSTAASLALNAVYGNRTTQLYSLRDLRLSDFFPYANSDIVVNGGTAPMPPPLARLALFPGGTSITTDCATYRYNEALIGLPPTNNPLQWALKAYLMQLKYRAVNNNDGSASDFGSLDPTSLQDDDPTRLNGTMQFAFVLGRSVKDALGVIRDAPVKSCSGSTCIDVEAAITSGAARIQLKDRLFDPMCLDTDTTCTYPAEKCRYVPLVPKTLALNPASVRATAAKLVAAIQQVATATTPTDTLQRHLQVAMTSSNDVFSDTVNLFWAAVVTGTKPKTLKAVPNFCNTPKFNPADGTLTAAWQANPCCNPLLAAFVCCVPQNVPNGVINVITGIQPAVVNAYCPLQSDLMLAFLNGAYVGLST
ncbi:hypothetical protein As57867_004397, partial [Aphanomyces stellatus]